jgi:acetoin:2,6-dichlorophenolindophenol oxidoreductase subunit beta
VAEIMFADFAGVCFDQLVNQLPKYRYMTGGQVTVPVTIRMSNGAGMGFGAQHSQPVENWFLNVPGLKLAVPATPGDLYALMRAAIRDPDPVIVFEHKHLFNLKGEVDRGAPVETLGRAEVVRTGGDMTIVATQLMRHRAVEAAEALTAHDLDAEVIDPRTLAPLDLQTIVDSLEKTNRLVVVQEAPPAGSWGASLVAQIMQEAFESLDGPPRLVAADDVPIPYAKSLEDAWMPSVERIVDSVREAAFA